MSKTIYIIIIILILTFLIPIIFTKRNVEVLSTENLEKETQIMDYDYSKYETIKLLHEDKNTIEEVKLDEDYYNEGTDEFDNQLQKAIEIITK